MTNDGNDPDLEATIARYRDELRAEADLARGDLDELEDHLRCMTADLRERGLPTGAAIAEAARRLGDPRALAREHARVSSPFGARLSRARAWSAVALLAPFAIYFAIDQLATGSVTSPAMLESVIAIGVVGALALRLSWARAIIAGTLPVALAWMIPWSLAWGGSRFAAIQIACYVGAFAFLAPWRRRDLSTAGLGLALLGPAYGGAATFLALQLTDERGAHLGGTLALLAFAAVLAGALGGLVRARWGAVACAVAAVGLALAVGLVWPLHVRYLHADVYRALIVGSLAVGSAAAAIAAVLGWRSARSTTGTLRGLLT